jgi:hypothetical protein
MIDLFALALSLLGFAALSLGLRRHQHDLLGRTLPLARTVAARSVGYGAIAAALALSVAGHGLGYGLMTGAGLLTVAAVLVMVGVTVSTKGPARCRQPARHSAEARARQA